MGARYVEANEIRNTGPSFDRWPADLPQVAYVTADGAFLCVTCANGGNGSLAADEGFYDGSETGPDDRQWRIVGAQTVSWDEDTDRRTCAHCGREIRPAESDR